MNSKWDNKQNLHDHRKVLWPSIAFKLACVLFRALIASHIDKKELHILSSAGWTKRSFSFRENMDVLCVFPFMNAKLTFIDLNLLQVSFSAKKRFSSHSKSSFLLLKSSSTVKIDSNVLNRVSTGLSDPFCVVRVNNSKKFKTNVAYETLTPVWNESVSIAMPQGDDKINLVSVNSHSYHL